MDQPDKGLLGNGLPKMIEDYGTKMSFSESYTWDIDQHILSHAILSSGLCSLPGDNKLWKELNIEPRLVGIHSMKGRVVNLGSVTFGKHNYRISSYSFRGNYSFLTLALFTVTFDHST